MFQVLNSSISLEPVDLATAVKESQAVRRPQYLAILSQPHFFWSVVEYSLIQNGPENLFTVKETKKQVGGLDVKQLFRLPRPLTGVV